MLFVLHQRARGELCDGKSPCDAVCKYMSITNLSRFVTICHRFTCLIGGAAALQHTAADCDGVGGRPCLLRLPLLICRVITRQKTRLPVPMLHLSYFCRLPEAGIGPSQCRKSYPNLLLHSLGMQPPLAMQRAAVCKRLAAALATRARRVLHMQPSDRCPLCLAALQRKTRRRPLLAAPEPRSRPVKRARPQPRRRRR